MKSILIISFLLLSNLSLNAQHEVYQNLDSDNTQFADITLLLKNYINGVYKPEDIFSQYDIETYPTIDITKEALSLGGTLYSINFDVNILSIKKEGDNYLAKAMLYWKNENQTITVLGILDFWIKKEDLKFKISNYLNYYTRNWSSTVLDDIKFVYYPDFPFDIHSARISLNFYTGIKKLFNIEDQEMLTYFIGNNCQQINQMAGFSFFISEGNDSNLCAYYDVNNNIIYSGNSEGEMNFHELVHVINKYYPTSNSYMLMGLSCYINDAGSRGKDLLFHLKRFIEYSKSIELDFENFENFGNIDDYTNIDYVTGGIICNALYRKGGMKLILEFLNDTEDIEVFKARLKKELKIKNFKKFFETEFEVFLRQKKSLLYIDN